MKLTAQRGATAVEFALVFLIFATYALGILDFARMLFTWNAATEATRAGARFAVVCDDTLQKPVVIAKMRQMVPEIRDISLTWDPAGCSNLTCEGVTVRITDLKFKWISPILGAVTPTITMPTFQTYLPRENMRRDPNSNTICNS